MFNPSKGIVIVLLTILIISCSTDNKVPDFELQTFKGKIITSTELKGKIVVLDFWDTHCGPCLKMMPHMEKLYSRYESNPDVVILVVNAGWQSIDEANNFVSNNDYDLPFTYMTKQESRKLKVREIPKTIVIDKQFNYRLQYVGYDGYDPDKDQGPVNELDKLIEILLSEK